LLYESASVFILVFHHFLCLNLVFFQYLLKVFTTMDIVVII
jgi:hypothetical protein